MRRVIILAAWAAGCSAGDRVDLGYPPLGDARSAILAVTDGAIVYASAADVGDPGTAIVMERPDSPLDAELELLLYDDPLTALGLPAGAIRRAVAPAGSLLPTPDEVFGARITAGEASGWVPAAAPSADVRDFRSSVTGPERCRPLRIRTATLSNGPDFAMALDDQGDTILMGFERNIYLLRGEELVEADLAGLPDFVPFAGRRRGMDPFFGGADGRIASARVDGRSVTLTLATTATAAPEIRFIDGGISGEGYEYFALSLDGTISRLLPGHDEYFRGSIEPLEPTAAFGGIIRLRSGKSVAGAASSAQVVFNGDPVVTRPVPSGVTAVELLGGVGLLVGTSEGEIRVETPSGFEPLFDTGIALPLTAIAGFREDGVLYASAQGQIGYWQPAIGACFDEMDALRSEARFIIYRPRYGDWVITGNKLERSSARYAIVTVE